MSAIQLLEEIATNPNYKSNLLADGPENELSKRAKEQVEDLMQSQTKIWCALFPADDDEAPSEDDNDEEKDDSAINL